MAITKKQDNRKAASRIFSDYLAAQKGNIPDLPDVEALSERVVRLLGGNPGEMQLQGTNTYLIGTGRSRILIDTGEGSRLWIRNLVNYLDTHRLNISYVLLTHWHQDHTGGVPDLIAYYPELATRIFKNSPDRGQLGIEDGQLFQVENGSVRAVLTPGHAFDHMCFILEEEQAMFTGDNILGHGFTVVEDLHNYLLSLRHMSQLQCLIGYAGHGAKIDDLRTKINTYISREVDRVAEVYNIMAKESKLLKRSRRGRVSFTNRDVVTLLYGDVSDDLFHMALGPCMELCLWKLAEEGKVAFQVINSNREWYPRVGPLVGKAY